MNKIINLDWESICLELRGVDSQSLWEVFSKLKQGITLKTSNEVLFVPDVQSNTLQIIGGMRWNGQQ